MKLSTTRARQAPLVEMALSAALSKAQLDKRRASRAAELQAACRACSRRSSPWQSRRL